MTDQMTRSSWHQQDAVVLENSHLRVVIVPGMGAKIVSLYDVELKLEWLVGPGSNTFQPVPYGASFVDQDLSGWDEMFPTIVACDYPGPGAWEGAYLPDHGEVWSLPWEVLSGSGTTLTCAVEGRALPYRLTRTARLEKSKSLHLTYQLENRGSETFSYLWAAHPQFLTGKSARIHFPDQVRQVVNTLPADYGWGDPDQVWSWPVSTGEEKGSFRLDQIGPPSRGRARKFYLPPEDRIGWVEIHRSDPAAKLRMEWSVPEIPYFGIWVDEGAISEESIAAPEPATGYYDSLETAWDLQQVAEIEPGCRQSWSLAVKLRTGGSVEEEKTHE